MDHDEDKRENFESSMDLLEERGAVEDEEEEEAEEEGILEADISDTVVDETAEDDELYISSVEDGVEPGGSELDVKLEPMSPPPSPTSICQIENVVSGSADVDTCEDEDPKDIELEYDDTIVTVVDSKRELGIRKCDILLPNFKYKTKHLNSAKRFPVGKLKNSHPEFFKKKGNGKKTSSSKSMGGGFAVKALIKKEKEEETPSKKSAKVSKKPMKEEWIKAPQKPLIKSVKKESVSNTSCDPAPSSTPNLKEVTIKNLRVGVERLHKNIVNFKYKQYKEFMDKQNPPYISKEDDIKKKKLKNSTPKKGKKANVEIKNEPAAKSVSKSIKVQEQKSPKSTKESSRLFEKFGINTDTSSDSENEKESPVKTETKINGTLKPQKPEPKSHKKLKDPKPNGERKISTEKRKISSEKRKSLSVDKSEDEDLSKESTVITNPFFQTDLPPDGKDRQEKEKEKLVEMLFSLIKGSKTVSGVTIKTEVTEEIHKKTSLSEPRKTSISETTPNKTPILETTPNTIPRSETTPNKTPLAEPTPEKTSENSISMPKSSEIEKTPDDSSAQTPDASVEPTPINSTLDNTSTRTQEPEKHIEPLISDPFEQLFGSSEVKSEKSASENRSAPVKELDNFQVPEASIFAGGDEDFFDDACIDDREGSSDGAVSDHDENIPAFAFTKSSEIERKKWLLPNLFKQTPELQLLRALLELHSEEQRILTKSSMTLGELENSMQSAINNINQLVIDTKVDRVKRKKRDYRRLRTFNMRGVQVNIKNVKNEDTAAYEKALKVFNERNGDSIYLWDYDRKSRLINNSQSSVKKRFIRSRSLSSSSSDNSPVRNREPNRSPKSKKSEEQGSDSETDSQKESQKKAEKHQKKPEFKRGKDEKKNRDPNKFKIPKVSQVAENKQTLKSILEEGLKKGVSTPQKSYHSPQTRHVGRYQDWRKEQRIKEVVRKKEKVIDIKKIEEQIAKPAAAPNFVDNILSSMDKLKTHKPESAKSTEKLDSEQPNLTEKPSPARASDELALQEIKLKEREADKIRHQEKRMKDLAENMIAPANPMTDLTSDEWGAPIGKSQLHIIVPKLKTSAPAECIDDNSDDDLPEPVSAVADEDDFPVPVPSIPLSPRSIQNMDRSKLTASKDPAYNHEKVTMDQHVSESNDDCADDYNDDNGGGFDDYDDDDDQSHQVAKVVESPVKTVESKKFVRDRSRTPSPFLRCNRYYPEFYAKKVAIETAPKSIQSTIPTPALPLPAVPAPIPHPYLKQQSAQVRPPDPVLASFPPTPVPAPSSSSILSSVRFPSDIDQRIAKHFRDKRSKQQSRKRKSENEAYEPSTSPLWQASLEEKRLPVPKGKTFKDFQIDPMDSFMLNPPKDIVGSDVESKDLGSRLTGAGLGVFINKVISSLKTTKKEDSGKIKGSGGLYLPSLRTHDEDYERERPSQSIKLLPPLDDLPPLPPDPVVDLEPGELPDSPPRPPPDSPPHSHYDDDDDSSTINVQEADLDDSMILEIVGELDDTLEEEEKLFRAKEKLAKHLLKKKSDLSSTWESKKPMSERGHSVRKMMIMQLPNQSKPAVPDIIQALNQPPPPPPHLLQQVKPQVQDYVRSNNHQVDDNDIDSFASSWGFQDNSREENNIAEPPQDEGFSSAISKLRGARPPPVPHMSSALEKLRSMKRRTILESPFYEPSPKRERLQDMNSPSVSRVLDEFMEPENFTNPLFNFRNEMKTGQSNINARFNDVENFNGPRGGGLLPDPRFDPGSEREEPTLNPMFQNSSQINNLLVDNSWINSRDAPFPQNPPKFFNKSNSSNLPNMNLQSDLNQSNFHHRPRLLNNLNSSNLPNFMNKSSDVNPTNPVGGRQPFPNSINEMNRPGFMSFPNPGNKTGLLGDPNDHENHQNFSSDFNRSREQERVPFQQNTRQTPPRDFFNGEGRTNFNGSNSRLEEQPGSDGPNSIQLQDDSEAHLADQLHNRLTTVTEREYLEKFMFDWNMLLRTEFQSQLLNFRRKQNSDEPHESAEIYDLGKEFNDYRLNQQVKDLQGGPDKDVFTSSLVEGNLQFKCEICNITVLGKRNMEGHMFGRKHKTKLEEFTIVENSEGPRKPPAVVPKPSVAVTDPGPISSLLQQYKAAPLIGLEYIVEIVGEKGEPDYTCLLCKFECKTRELMYHLLSAHHRLFYLSRFFPSARTKFSKVPNRRFWEKPTYDFLDSVINRIEFKFGRKSPFVLLAQHGSIEVEKKKLLNKLEGMEHFSECPVLDFGSLPDPFGAYLNRIPRHQIQL